jgi:hypothetical protein
MANPNDFHKKVGNSISKATARAWVNRYKNNPKRSKDLNSEFFGKDQIMQLLNHPDAVGIRIYNAENEKGEHRFVILSVSEGGHSILPAAEESTTEAATILEDGRPCPPYCNNGSGAEI